MGLPNKKVHTPAPLHIHPLLPKMMSVHPSSQFAAALLRAQFRLPPALSDTNTPVCALPFASPSIGSHTVVPPAPRTPASRLECRVPAVEGRGFIPAVSAPLNRASAPEAELRAPSREYRLDASDKISNSKLGRIASPAYPSKQRTSHNPNSKLFVFSCKMPLSTAQFADNPMIQKPFAPFSAPSPPPGAAW